MLHTNYFTKLLFLLLLLLSSSLYSADECNTSDFSSTLNSSNTSYTKSDSASKWNSDTFYINVSEPGDVTITITGNRMNFSYDESDCPDTSSGQTSLSKTFSSATYFNLKVYRTNNAFNLKDYTLTINFTPSTPPTPPTLIADYHFDECSWDGTTGEVKDTNNIAYNATAKDGADTEDSDGGINNVGSFDGSDYVEIPSIAALQIAGSQTYMAWIKHNSDDNTLSTIFMNSGWGNALRMQDNNKILFEMQIGGDKQLYSSSPIDDKWHHIAGVYDKSDNEMKLYVDGTLSNSMSVSGSLHVYTGESYVGTENGSNYFFKGNIDEVKVFDGASTATYIKDIYDNEKDGKNYDGSIRASVDCPMTTPVADYHFDECSWDGNNVEDSSGNNRPATAYAIDTTDSGKINRAGDFSEDNKNDYLSLDYNIMNGLDSLSVGIWVKTSDISSQQEIIQALGSSTNDDEFEFYLKDKNKITIKIMDDGEEFRLSNNEITDGSWHQLFVTRNSDEVCLYIDGSKKECKTGFRTGALVVHADSLIVGQEQDSYGGGFSASQNFVGTLDELIIFDSTLSETNIQDIYNNESASKNYDGTSRDSIVCILETANYQIDSCDIASENTLLDSSTNAYTATYAGDKVFLGEGKICSGIEIGLDSDIEEVNAFKSGLTVSTLGSKGTITFWYKSNQKWDENPGKMLVDATNGDKYFFLGLKSNGKLQYYLEDNTDGDFQSTTVESFSFAVDEWVHLTFSWDIPAKTYKVFVNGVEKSLSIGNNSAGGSGRTIPSGLNDLFIGDISFLYTQNASVYNGVNNSSDGTFDEIKLFNKVLPSNMILDIYTQENLGNNYLTQEARICPVCVVDEPEIKYSFDAWDTFRSITDRNISTKISGQSFNLNLVSLNETNDAYQDFNGTVCTCIDDITDKCFKNQFVENNNSSQTVQGNPLFNIDKAIKEAVVNIYWKQDSDMTCDDLRADSDVNSTTTTDNFAIRPKEFFIIPDDTSIKSGVPFNLSFVAGANAATPTTDYNETAGNSFDMNVSEQKPVCITGNFTPSITDTWSFTNGSRDINTKYNEVGNIDVNISEKSKPCSSRYAGVDCDDANVSGSYNSDTDLPILEKIQTLVFQADHFDVNVTSSNFDITNGFTYLANNIDLMRAKVDIVITAQDLDGSTATNYNSACYANDVKIDYIYSVVDDKLDNFNYHYNLNNVYSARDFESINDKITDTINSTYFSTDNNGSAVFAIEYNFDRSRSIAINPFDVNITELNAIDVSYVDTNGTAMDSASAKFLFARVMTKDIITTKSNINAITEIEVFDNTGSAYTQNFKQNSLFWYRHQNQTNNSDGNITEVIPTLNTTLGTGAFTINDIGAVSAGTIRIGIANSTVGHFTIHEKTQPWLWYVHSNFGDAYDHSDGSSCMQHPCFSYELKDPDSSKSIESGDFKGSDFNGASNRDYTKKGVKVFR